ncbi:PaaI family thioesterase [Yoonia sp.]|uniref:PaaI family thioesterase n=1 Tax=Yoonia sp. TaxID=2212373 RepID=UPI0039188112
MQLQMDIPALHDFIASTFPQVQGDFFVDMLAPGRIAVQMQVGDQHLRPGGTISGPAMFALADVTIYLLILAHIGPKALAVTTSCNLDFMRKPAAGQPLVCDARLLKLGKSLAVSDALIHSAGQAGPVARASMTYAIPPA